MTSNNSQTKKSRFLITAIAFTLLGGVVATAVNSVLWDSTNQQSLTTDPNKPLYWVAPMDANFKRDKPGKSPMGMDLIPVYADDVSAGESEVGAVRISSAVINNLGVKTQPVTFVTLTQTIKTVGYVQFDEDRLMHIHPRVEGWVEQLFVKSQGAEVKKGDPLYTLYSPQLVTAQQEFIMALNQTNQMLIKGAKDRLMALQIDASLIQWIEKNREVKQNITFYAPQTGVIGDLKVREGFFVKPGTTMMSIAKLDQVWVQAEVFEHDSSKVFVGQPVKMTLDYLPGRTWKGLVDYIYPSLNSETRTLRVRLKFDNYKGLLKPNMFAQIELNYISNEAAILVPKEAVIRTGSQDRVVIALGDGQFKSVSVTLGNNNDTQYEILKGLLKDDIVVTSAQFLIDSESSKSSDFKRMEVEEQESFPTATVMGVVNSINTDARTLNISRGPIEKWDRPAATMDFKVSRHINFDQFAANLIAGDKVHFTFEVQDDLVIVEIMKHD